MASSCQWQWSIKYSDKFIVKTMGPLSFKRIVAGYLLLLCCQRVASESVSSASSYDLPKVLPYEGFEAKGPQVCNVIEGKCYAEAYATRCWFSTKLENPLELAPSFVLFTKQQGNHSVFANATASQILEAGFDPTLYTSVFVHGFSQRYWTTPWLTRTLDLFRNHNLLGTQNVIVMDWSRAAKGSYGQVAARTSSMGSYLAHFLQKLIDELDVDSLRIHLIGHSLGALVPSFASRRVRPKIGRITSLDPASPCFGRYCANGDADKVRPDDAHEIEVYHYDDSFLGTPGQLGQFDVIVNGGHRQPKCEPNTVAKIQAVITLVFGRHRILSQSHTRAAFVASADLANCQLIAYECKNHRTFSRGECAHCDAQNNQCFSMSFAHQHGRPVGQKVALRIGKIPGQQFHIRTSGEGDFCVHHYQVLAELTWPKGRYFKLIDWQVRLDLHSENGDQTHSIVLGNQMKPALFSYLLLIDGSQKAVRFSNATIRLERVGLPVRLSQEHIQVQTVKVNFMSSFDYSQRKALSSRLCPTDVAPSSNLIEEALSLSECSASSE